MCAGIKNTSFRKYMKRLEEEGYIVWRKGNIIDFYTSPREPGERTNHECINFEETPCDVDSSHDEMEEIATRNVFTPDDGGDSHLVSILSQSNREINNREDIINNENKNIDSPSRIEAPKVKEIIIKSPKVECKSRPRVQEKKPSAFEF